MATNMLVKLNLLYMIGCMSSFPPERTQRLKNRCAVAMQVGLATKQCVRIIRNRSED